MGMKNTILAFFILILAACTTTSGTTGNTRGDTSKENKSKTAPKSEFKPARNYQLPKSENQSSPGDTIVDVIKKEMPVSTFPNQEKKKVTSQKG
jgi:uncharacterized lipoprotein